MLQSIGSQRIGHDWETEQQQDTAEVYAFLNYTYVFDGREH